MTSLNDMTNRWHTKDTPLGSRMKWRMESTSGLVPSRTHSSPYKKARIFVRGHNLFWEANSFPRANVEESCELRGTDNVQLRAKISSMFFKSNGGYCVSYPSNMFRNTRDLLKTFEDWAIIHGSPPVLAEDFQSRDAFGPIGYERNIFEVL